MPNPNQLSAVAELPSPAGTLPGLAARIGSTIGDALRSGYESLHNGYETARRNAKTYLALGATAFAGAQAAELSLNTDPAAGAENSPALTGAVALPGAPEAAGLGAAPLFSEAQSSASSLVQSCVDQELVRPQVKFLRVAKPGRLNQTTSFRVEYGETPEECRGVVKRNFQWEVLIKQVLRTGGKLRHVTGKLLTYYGSRFTKEEAGIGQLSLAVPAGDQSLLVHCSEGKANSKVILVNRGTIRSVATNQIIGRKFWRKAGEIIGRPKGCPPNDRL